MPLGSPMPGIPGAPPMPLGSPMPGFIGCPVARLVDVGGAPIIWVCVDAAIGAPPAISCDR